MYAKLLRNVPLCNCCKAYTRYATYVLLHTNMRACVLRQASDGGAVPRGTLVQCRLAMQIFVYMCFNVVYTRPCKRDLNTIHTGRASTRSSTTNTQMLRYLSEVERLDSPQKLHDYPRYSEAHVRCDVLYVPHV